MCKQGFLLFIVGIVVCTFCHWTSFIEKNMFKLFLERQYKWQVGEYFL